MSIGTVTDISLHGYETSAHALDSTSLSTQGWLLFIPTYNGSIGAFYFGTTPTHISIGSPALSTYIINPPNIVTTQNGFIVSDTWGVYSIPPPNIITTHDILVNFIGVPRVGSSPLIVDFTALVTIAAAAGGTVSVAEYHWYFDTINNPAVYEVSTGPTITHVYSGYLGQKFSIKLCVKLK